MRVKYNEPTNEYAYRSIIENTYNITRCKEDYVNPTTKGELTWRSVCFYDIDLEDEMARWQNNLCEVLTKRCV
jgi:hypothetical protein